MDFHTLLDNSATFALYPILNKLRKAGNCYENFADN